METRNACSWKAPLVELVNGQQVPSDSREWLLECEARYVLNLPTKADRYALLDAIEKKRGRDARMELHDRVMQLHFATKEREARNV
jgi:hypothetical protein